MIIVLTPFYCAGMALYLVPILYKMTDMKPIMIPMGLLWNSFLICIIQRPLWDIEFLSLNQARDLINKLRQIKVCSKVGLTYDRSIDTCNWGLIEASIKQ
jgi:hypothetical protein